MNKCTKRFVMKCLVCVFMVASFTAVNAYEEHTFDEPKDQALYDKLIAELRCLVCQNQNIADSDADLAVDLRNEIYSMIGTGQTKSDIIDFMVQRYGEFVLYKPRFSTKTLILWLAPALLLLLGSYILYRSTVNARKQTVTAPDDAALARARSLLKDD